MPDGELGTGAPACPDVALALAVIDPAAGVIAAAALSSAAASGRHAIVLEGSIGAVLRPGPACGPMDDLESRWILGLVAQGVTAAEAVGDFAAPGVMRAPRLLGILAASGDSAVEAPAALRSTACQNPGVLFLGCGLSGAEVGSAALAALTMGDRLGPVDRILRALAAAGQAETASRGENPFRSAVLRSGVTGAPSLRGQGTGAGEDLRIDDGDVPWEGLERIFDVTRLEAHLARDGQREPQPLPWTEALRQEVAEALPALSDGESVRTPADSPAALARWFERRRLTPPSAAAAAGNPQAVDAARFAIFRDAARRHCVAGLER